MSEDNSKEQEGDNNLMNQIINLRDFFGGNF